MLLEVVAVVVGLVFLTIAADKLVEGAVGMANRLGVTPMLIGLTVVAWGTSAPELVVSVQASIERTQGIAVGNVVGSNIFNAAAILGLTALICPIPCQGAMVRRDVPIMIAVSLLVWGFARDAQFDRIEGVILVALIIAYTYMSYRWAKSDPNPEIPPEVAAAGNTSVGVDLVRILVGLVGMVVSSKGLLWGAVGLAKRFGFSDEVIGLTLVAAGTSAPELATSVVAAWRKQPDIAVGNVVGSNIVNLLGILGVAATVMPLSVSSHMVGIDLPVMVVVTLGCLPIMRTGMRITRLEGFVLVTAFVLYNISLYLAPG